VLSHIITSKTRIKLLLKLFLNSNTRSHLREMEREFGESNNAIRQELSRLKKANLICCTQQKGKILYRANTEHPLFPDIRSILRKTVGIDKIIDKVTTQIGNLQCAYLTGSFAEGIDSDTIELVLVGQSLDLEYIAGLTSKAGQLIGRKIIYVVMTAEQMQYFLKDRAVLLIWQSDQMISQIRADDADGARTVNRSYNS
jgi:DNA-binding transcriptional ArsR family regulator